MPKNSNQKPKGKAMPAKTKVTRKENVDRKAPSKPKSAGNGITGKVKPKKKKMY